MKRFFLKNIFAAVLFILLSMPILKAEEAVPISVGSGFITTEVTISGLLSDRLSEINNNNYNYILFNGALTYGGEANALSTCNKYCNNCQKYQRNPDEYAFYVCKIYNFKADYFPVHDDSYIPVAIKKVNSTDFPKVSAAFKCRYVKYTGEWNISGQPGLTGASDYHWVCESKLDCENTCSGSCVAPLFPQTENRDKLYSCHGRKLPNVFVTIDGKEVNADTLSAISDSELKDWVAKTGDGIKAGFKGILIVIGSEGTLTCSGGLGEAISIIKYIFNFIKIGSVIMLILFSVLDFMKNITSDEKDMKKPTNNFVKRAVVVVVLFILPSLINLILSIIGYSQGVCGL